MPISYRLKGDLLMFRAQGEVSVRDFYRAWDEITTGQSFELPINTLIDLREAQIDVPGEEIEGIVYDLKHHQFFNRMVFVAERGSFTYAMGRMFCINAECAGCTSEIFLHISDALSWINCENTGGECRSD